MIKYEDECVDCGLPCMGRTCPYKNVPHFYCDSCKDEHESVYEFDGEELCIECIIKRLPKVKGE